MRFFAALLFVILAVHPACAADQAQAKEVARLNNCPPKKIEVYQQTLGAQGQTIYRVDCNMPKSKSEDGPVSNAMLVSCDESLCELLRSLPPDSK